MSVNEFCSPFERRINKCTVDLQVAFFISQHVIKMIVDLGIADKINLPFVEAICEKKYFSR